MSLFSVHPSWNKEQLQFIGKCIQRHGHSSLWTSGATAEMTLKSMTGLIPTLKGAKSYFKNDVLITFNPMAEEVTFKGLSEKNDVGSYQKGSVTYGQLHSEDHRKTFSGLKKLRMWSVLDTLYFFGYAITTYYSVPSILPSLKLTKEIQLGEYRGFRVQFSEGYNTHCREQAFFFSDDGLLYRHDYTADVLGFFAVGAHVTQNYVQTSEGLMLARERDVYFRMGNWPSPIAVLSARISAASK